MCDVCNDTGFELRGNDAHYCECMKGQRVSEAHRRGPESPARAKATARREWQPYSDADEDAPVGGR